MEIEVDAAHLRKKALLLGLLVVTLITAGLAIAQHQQPVKPPVTSVTLAPPGAQENISLTFLDESTQWDWQPAGCMAPLAKFLPQGQVVQMILGDDAAEQHEVVTYPAPGHPGAATVAAQCRRSSTGLECRLGVRDAGKDPANLNVAAAAALANALQELARPKTQAAVAARPVWAWANFQPVLVQEQDGWQACLALSATK